MPSDTQFQLILVGAAVLQLLVVVIQTVIFWLTAHFAKRQLAEIRHARCVDIHLKLFDELNSPTAVDRRRMVYQAATLTDMAAISDEMRKEINTLVNQFDFLGFLVDSEFVSFKLIESLYQGTIIRSWLATKEFVKNERKQRLTLFAEHFEKLALRCEENNRKLRPHQEIAIEPRNY